MGAAFQNSGVPKLAAQVDETSPGCGASVIGMVQMIDHQGPSDLFIAVQSPERFCLRDPFSCPKFLAVLVDQVGAFTEYLPALDRGIDMSDPVDDLISGVQGNGAAEDRVQPLCGLKIKGVGNEELGYIFVAMIFVYGIMEGLDLLE